MNRRKAETDQYFKLGIFNAVQGLILHFFNCSFGTTILGVYIGFGNTLDLAKAFTALSYIGMAMHPMRSLPHFINEYNEYKVAMGRIEKFLKTKEVDHD